MVQSEHLQVRIGNWGKATKHALDLVKRGRTIALVEDGQVVGILCPPQSPVTEDLLLNTLHWHPDAVAEFVGFGTLGEWHWVPGTREIRTLPPAKIFLGGPGDATGSGS